MSYIESRTCIRFRRRQANDVDYLLFIDAGHQSCFSYIGRIGGMQEVSIGMDCALQLGKWTNLKAIYEKSHNYRHYRTRIAACARHRTRTKSS